MVQYISADKAGLLSTVLEALLYGFSVLMFIATLWILVRGRPWSQVNHRMFVIACLLFALSTIHLGVDINRLVSGFIRFRDITPGGPPAWFANPSDPSFVFKSIVYGFQTALGDGVVIYRCYMVWNSIWVIIFPIILWFGVVGKSATATGGVYACTSPSTDSTGIFAQQVGKWITAFYSTTLACNLTATALLAYRLWTIDRNVRRTRVGRGVTIPILLVVVDAGALYSMTLLSALIGFALGSNGQYVVLDMVTPIISIAFYMVILRIGIAQHSPSRDNTNASTLPRVPFSRPETSGRFGKPMHVHIQVEQVTESRRSAEKGVDEVNLPMQRYQSE
ncbi:hypothetical protein DFH08DRAFT_899119 [Mycena albidolilacea]|uniref:Uncharacterized protein n=1 Tax=Mycena albidolilacea TaxID=1033008 RepID=A0AAD7EBG5_9AGAR|nr:hypothetical protein DFH08DRAFT_899119 [Mycena albidolilacea]